MNRNRAWLVLSVAILLALAPAAAVASSQSGEQKADSSGKQAAAKKQAQKPAAKEELPLVITNDTLEQLFGGAEPPESSVTAEGAIPAVIPEPGAAQPAAEGAPAPGAPAAGSAPAASAPPVDTAARAAQIQQEIERLNKRVLALQNPLLRGTAPPTDEESEELAGKDNAEQLQATRARIAELQAELSGLQGGGGEED